MEVFVLSAFLYLMCTLHIFTHPDSVDVPIENLLDGNSITGVYYLIPGSNILHTAYLEYPLLPGETVSVSVPFVYMRKLIFEAENGSIYRLTGYPASTNADTISITLARKEFGGVFERIYGDHPVAIGNSTDVQITAVFLSDNSLSGINLLRRNVLLPDEVLRIWLDSGTSVQVTAFDADGNISTPLASSTSYPDSIYQITPPMFFSSGDEIGYSDSHAGSRVVNSITLGKIVLIEAFSSDGFLLDGLDCSSSPLNTWDRVYIRHNIPIDFVVLTDENGRTFSADAVDSLTGAFILSDFNLDFGFDFP